jgi:O-antigen/teichoic acid export membrane protein
MASLLTASALPAETAVRRGVAWSLLGRVAYGACQFGVLVAITRLGGSEDIGAFSLALALTAPPMVLANLQLRSLYATDVGDRFAWSSYARVRIVVTALALGICLALVPALGLHGLAAAAVFAMAIAKASETFSDLHHAAFQRFAKMDRFGKSMTLRGSGSIVLVAGALAFGLGLALALAAMAAWWCLVQLAFDAPQARALRPVDDHTTPTLPLVWQALPMGLVFLVDSLHQNVPRYFVESMLGNAALGFFTPMTYVVVIGSAFVFAQAAPRAPLLARAWQRGDRAAYLQGVTAICTRTGTLGLAGIAAAVLVGRPALGSMFGTAWVEHADAFVWIAIGGALHFVMVPLMLALTAARALRVQLVCYGAAFVAAAIACAAWLPDGGLVAAARAGACGMATGVLAGLVALRRAARASA